MAAPASGLSAPDINPSGNPEFLKAFESNGQLAAKDYRLKSIQATLEGGTSYAVPIPGGNKVSFAASGSFYASVGAYSNRATLLSDLGFDNPDWQGLDFNIEDVPNSRYATLAWGYSGSGSAEASIALLPSVSANFAVEARNERMYAIIRREPSNKGAADCVADLRANWISPAAVNGLLPQGTWMVAECNAAISASLGIQAGYTYSWVKSLNVQGLSGDVGLKIALGLDAALGIDLTGKYFFVLSCDEDPKVIRYRLFRTATKGWNFVLNAGAEITGNTGTFLPDQLNDLLKAVLGVHQAQLLKYLQASSLQDIEDAGFTDLLKELDPGGSADKGFAAVSNLVKKWDNLPGEARSMIWSHLNTANSGVLDEVISVATKLANASPQTVTDTLDTLLHASGFEKTPAVQWLESVGGKGLFALYEDSAASQVVSESARQLLQVLDRDVAQQTLIRLQKQVNDSTNLDQLQAVISSGNLTGITTWVKQKLADFLGVDTSAFDAEAGKINDFIKQFRANADELYGATIKALNSTYSFQMHYAYQSSNTSTALVDIEFDSTALNHLQEAIAGRLRLLLDGANPLTGVTVRAATLTHGIRRNENVELNIPHYVSTYQDINSAFSKETISDTESGRIHLFEAGGKDEILERGNNSFRRYSALSLAISGAAKDVNRFDVDSVDFGWENREVHTGVSRHNFALQYRPVVQTYFDSEFGKVGSSPHHADFDEWVSDWDKLTDANPTSTPSGDGLIGTVWSKMQLQFSSVQSLSWVDALMQSRAKPNYPLMAAAIQRRYRELIWRSYVNDLAKVAKKANNLDNDCFFTWVSLPPGPLADGDLDEIRSAISSPETLHMLQAIYREIFEAMSHDTRLRNNAGYYDPSHANAVLSGVLMAFNAQGVRRVWQFLLNEAEIVAHATKGFEAIRQAGGHDLVGALRALEIAGLNITKAFNSDVRSDYDSGNLLRYFSVQIFQEALSSILPKAAPRQVDAILDIAVLKSSGLPVSDDPPAKDDILYQQALVSF